MTKPRKRPAPRLTTQPPAYQPLMIDGEYSARLRARVLGLPAAVYVLRRIGNERPEYVGSSLPGEKKDDPETADRRAWKTILRHFHAIRSKQGRRAYSFGRDNWTDREPEAYEVAVLECDPRDVRQLEQLALDTYRPRHKPPGWIPPEQRDDYVPF